MIGRLVLGSGHCRGLIRYRLVSRRPKRKTRRNSDLPETPWAFVAWLLRQSMREYMLFVLLVVLVVAAVRLGGCELLSFVMRHFR